MNVAKYEDRPIYIAYGLFLFFNSRSYSLTFKSLEPKTKISHLSICKWVQKYSRYAAAKFKVDGQLVNVCK